VAKRVVDGRRCSLEGSNMAPDQDFRRWAARGSNPAPWD